MGGAPDKLEVKSKGEQYALDLLKQRYSVKTQVKTVDLFTNTTQYEKLHYRRLEYDVVLDNKYIIEVDGIQHFDRSTYYPSCHEHDNIKTLLALKYGYNIIRIYWDGDHDWFASKFKYGLHMIHKFRVVLLPKDTYPHDYDCVVAYLIKNNQNKNAILLDDGKIYDTKEEEQCIIL